MTSLDEPMLKAMLAEADSDLVIADWLMDKNVEPWEVALLDAGTPPCHKDGISRKTVAAWLERRFLEEDAALVKKVEVNTIKRPILEEVAGEHYGAAPVDHIYRGEKTVYRLHWWNAPQLWPCYEDFKSEDQACRQAKRVVLGLLWAADVKVGWTFKVSEELPPWYRTGSQPSGSPINDLDARLRYKAKMKVRRPDLDNITYRVCPLHKLDAIECVAVQYLRAVELISPEKTR